MNKYILTLAKDEIISENFLVCIATENDFSFGFDASMDLSNIQNIIEEFELIEFMEGCFELKTQTEKDSLAFLNSIVNKYSNFSINSAIRYN